MAVASIENICGYFVVRLSEMRKVLTSLREEVII